MTIITLTAGIDPSEIVVEPKPGDPPGVLISIPGSANMFIPRGRPRRWSSASRLPLPSSIEGKMPSIEDYDTPPEEIIKLALAAIGEALAGLPAAIEAISKADVVTKAPAVAALAATLRTLRADLDQVEACALPDLACGVCGGPE
jgi:hypothetical protein